MLRRSYNIRLLVRRGSACYQRSVAFMLLRLALLSHCHKHEHRGKALAPRRVHGKAINHLRRRKISNLFGAQHKRHGTRHREREREPRQTASSSQTRRCGELLRLLLLFLMLALLLPLWLPAQQTHIHTHVVNRSDDHSPPNCIVPPTLNRARFADAQHMQP